MPGNWHVRFGERRAETSRREAVWRCAPTLPFSYSGRAYRDLDGWRQTGGDRPAPRRGRNIVEGSQGVTLLFREEWRAAPGEESRDGCCRDKSETARSAVDLRSDMPNRGRKGRA